MRWSPENLDAAALPVSASRRTDIPALFAPWFARRLEEGVVEYVPAGPPRRVRRSLRPEHVAWFTFWSNWPRPFLPVLDRVLEAGFPVLWNVTITGLGGTDVEPAVPTPDRVVRAVHALVERVPAAAILWRYDPVFVSDRFDAAWHRDTFARLADALSGKVDRVAISFVSLYGRRVAPDLRAWERETGDRLVREADVELARALQAIAAERGLALTTCCMPELRAALGCAPAGCSDGAWAERVYPALTSWKRRPTRPDCACAAEIDIGVYDTCTLGCRYSYGTCAQSRALAVRHDPEGACILP